MMTEQKNTIAANTGQDQAQSCIQAMKQFNMADYYRNQFKSDVLNFKESGRLKSGFANLDAITNLYPGLYVVGAVSSLGKTTFVHQMCEQIAESGNHVLYFSLEQSTLELASKSIARSIAKADAANGLSSLQVRRANPSDSRIVSAVNRCSAYSDKMTVTECSFRATINDIANTVQSYIEEYKVKPVVAIDYLQVIQPDQEMRLTVKDTIDYHMKRLKELQTDNQLTMIVISSLNRQNYMAAIDFESFKESGGIEYTADVVWGLQLQCIHEALFSSPNKVNEKRKRVKEAKRAVPRKIELACLKNRFGVSSYSCQFDYYPNYDWFKPDLSNLDMNAIACNNSDTDGFMTIPAGLDSEIPWPK